MPIREEKEGYNHDDYGDYADYAEAEAEESVEHESRNGNGTSNGNHASTAIKHWQPGRGKNSRAKATLAGTVKITPKEEAFVSYYIGEANFNAAKAAKLAGFKDTSSNLAKMGSRIANKPAVRAYIDDQLRVYGMSPMEVIYRLTQIARSSLEDYLQFDEEFGLWRIDIMEAKRQGKMYALEEIRRTKEGISIKLQNRLDALEKLARIHRMLGHTTEVNVNVDEVNVLTNEERRLRILSMIEEAESRQGFAVGENGEEMVIEAELTPGEARETAKVAEEVSEEPLQEEEE